MDVLEELVLKYILSLLVCLILFVCFFVLPPDHSLTLPACYVPHNVLSCRHAPLLFVVFDDVVDEIEEIRLAMLATKGLAHQSRSIRCPQVWLGETHLGNYVLRNGEMRFALFATVYLVSREVFIVRETHLDRAHCSRETKKCCGMTLCTVAVRSCLEFSTGSRIARTKRKLTSSRRPSSSSSLQSAIRVMQREADSRREDVIVIAKVR